MRTAGKTGIAGQLTTVTNTTENVMLASQCPGYNPRAVVTTCAALEWSVCLGFVGRQYPVEPKEQNARRIANVIRDCAV
ncbi:hypothetical protein OS493_016160 [Desmophyllum pertusum]|uniref:Uncharacterized protein n=1 Tax=Desmophyllum pertusum TaxID=174260 RepID=A0A9X0A2I5_9CNID|nr:hypothetical protein OS493_016160 [Desmophyllum pertusum]